MSALKLTRVHVLLSKIQSAPAAAYLRSRLPDISIVEMPVNDWARTDGNSLTDQDRVELHNAEVILTTPPLLFTVLDSLPKLHWAQLTFAGVDLLMKQLPPGKAPAFPVTRYASESFARELAEYVLAAVLGYERKFHLFVRAQSQHRWVHPWWNPEDTLDSVLYRPMRDLTIAVLGTGAMGSQAGLLLKQLGCAVHGFSRTVKSPNEIFDKMFCGSQLLECLQSADYICNLLPSTAETRGLLTSSLLSSLPRRPVFVNAGRGDVVEEPVLVHALREGWLSGAVLDVFDPEPLAEHSPLWDMEQVTITPHIANLPNMQNFCDQFLENLGRLQRGESLMHVVDFAAGY